MGFRLVAKSVIFWTA